MNAYPLPIEETAFADVPLLITGGAGFIGSHLANALAAHGAEVRVIDDLSSGSRRNLSDDIELYEASILDRSVLEAAMSDCRFVFHLAALVSVAESVADARECMRINVDGTQSVLETAMHAGVSRVVCATSAAAYGESPNLPSREVDPFCCCSPYAVSKVACECLMQAYARCYGLSTISLRLFNIFGPRQDPKSPYAAVISAFTDALINGWHPKVFGDGNQTRDFTYVDNVVHAFELAATTRRELQGEVANIGCGRRISLLAALDAMSQALEVSVMPLFEAPRNGDVRDSQADITMAGKLLGYAPIVQFEEGIERTMLAAQERSLRPEPTELQ
jgi:nucleoside-diphosphate-sugar epimerase